MVLLVIHPNLYKVTLCNVITSLISPNPREWMCSVKTSLLIITFPSHISWGLALKQSTKEYKARIRTHHVVIFVIIAMLTLC